MALLFWCHGFDEPLDKRLVHLNPRNLPCRGSCAVHGSAHWPNRIFDYVNSMFGHNYPPEVPFQHDLQLHHCSQKGLELVLKLDK